MIYWFREMEVYEFISSAVKMVESQQFFFFFWSFGADVSVFAVYVTYTLNLLDCPFWCTPMLQVSCVFQSQFPQFTIK